MPVHDPTELLNNLVNDLLANPVRYGGQQDENWKCPICYMDFHMSDHYKGGEWFDMMQRELSSSANHNEGCTLYKAIQALEILRIRNK